MAFTEMGIHCQGILIEIIMAKYILSILRMELMVVFSWGFHRPTALPNDEGLAFKVDGFKHRGWVFVKYNEGKDLFDIELRGNDMTIIRVIEDVYFDQLVTVIDNAVEHTENYEEQVKELYNIQ